MPRKPKPPVVLEGCRIEQFALRGRSMRFTGRGRIVSRGKEVGSVPRLALGRAHDNEVVLFHCDARWNVVGTSWYSNLREAKEWAERRYSGISKAWIRTGYTKTQSNRYLERSGANRKCSLCAKPWFEVHQMIEVRRIVICDECIRKLHTLISSPGDGPAV